MRPIKQAWARWIRVAEVIGNIQFTIILSLIYFSVFVLTALPFKLLADPLMRRNRAHTTWHLRHPRVPTLEEMREQY